MKVPRICLLTPGHLSTNPRLVKEADALSAAGYDVSVISAHYMDWGIQHDRAFASRPWTVVKKVTFGPLATKQTRIRQVLWQRLAGLARSAGLDSGSLREARVHPAAPDLTSAACAVRADLYIAHYTAALPAAARAASVHRVLYAFDAEDFHLGDLPDLPEHEAAKSLIRAIEKDFLPGAAYISAAAPGIARAYVDEYGIEAPTVLLNVFSIPDDLNRATVNGAAKPGPSLFWFSQTIGPKRGIETALDAIARSRTKPHLYLRGRPISAFLDEMRRFAFEQGIGDRLHLLEIAAPDEMVKLSAAFDLGLVSETADTRNRALCLSNKLFTFIAAGVPPIISATPAQAEFARSAGLEDLVFPVGDADSLACLLDEVLSDPGRLADLRSECFELARTRFNWERESRILLDLVSRTVGPPSKRSVSWAP